MCSLCALPVRTPRPDPPLSFSVPQQRPRLPLVSPDHRSSSHCLPAPSPVCCNSWWLPVRGGWTLPRQRAQALTCQEPVEACGMDGGVWRARWAAPVLQPEPALGPRGWASGAEAHKGDMGRGAAQLLSSSVPSDSGSPWTQRDPWRPRTVPLGFDRGPGKFSPNSPPVLERETAVSAEGLCPVGASLRRWGAAAKGVGSGLGCGALWHPASDSSVLCAFLVYEVPCASLGGGCGNCRRPDVGTCLACELLVTGRRDTVKGASQSSPEAPRARWARRRETPRACWAQHWMAACPPWRATSVTWA